MPLRSLICCLAVLGLPLALTADETPNIVLIYVDDLGFGDVGAYGATEVKTPNIDRIAAEGCRFTDGHCPSATCTPSRYAMLTGEYAFRQDGTGIARGDAPAIIDPGRETVASVLKRAGYSTGVVGKWHLGLGNKAQNGPKMDWNGKIAPGPLEIGFDYCFLMPATGDRVPCVYVEDHGVVDLDPNDPIQVSFGKPIGDRPTGKDHPELLKMKWHHGHNNSIINGISRIGYMKGGKAAEWIDEDIADVFSKQAVEWIEQQAKTDEPFFLFFSLHDIHVPRVPHSRFVGSSGLGPRGDVIVETDFQTGEILKALDRLNLTDDTLVIFSSDNGPVLNDGYYDDAVEKLGSHDPNGPWRGGKYSAFEAGTRVPFITRWPDHIKAGSTSDALVGQVDLMASMAELTGQRYDESTAPDTLNQLGAWLGKDETGRTELVEHAKVLSLRVGDWKYIAPGKGPKKNQNTNTELGNDTAGQLYNLADDPGETTNLVKSNQAKAKELADRLNAIAGQ